MFPALYSGSLLIIYFKYSSMYILGLPSGSDGKESLCNVGDSDSISASGRSPGEGNGYPLPYSCLENSINRGIWQATVHEVAKSGTTERLTHTVCTLIPNSQPISFYPSPCYIHSFCESVSLFLFCK